MQNSCFIGLYLRLLTTGLILCFSGCDQSGLEQQSSSDEAQTARGEAHDGVSRDEALQGTDGEEISDGSDIGQTGQERDGEERTSETSGLCINEIVAKASDGGMDWVELFVSGEQNVSLANFTLVDDHPDHIAVTLPEITLAPGEFYVLLAVDEEDMEAVDAPAIPFKLGSEDGLFLALQGTPVDSLTWQDGDAPEGASFGRLADGSDTTVMLDPTPGESNQVFSGTVDERGSDNCDAFIEDRVLPVTLELSAEAWAAIKSNPMAEEYHQGNLLYDGLRLDDVAIRVKGNSSLNSVSGSGGDRFSFKVDMNRHVEGQKFCGLKKLNFNNGFKDPTLLREYLGYQLAHDIGIPAPRTAFADLTVGDLHLGLYTVVEHIDDEFIEDHYEIADGDLYKPEHPSGGLSYRGPSIEDYQGLDIEENADTSDHSAVMNLITVMNQGLPQDYASVLDIDSVLRYIVLNTLLVNLDSYTGNGHNYYLYEQEGVFSVIPWDFNEAFGNFTCGCDRQGIIDFMIDEPTCGTVNEKALVGPLLDVPEHRETYHGYLASTIEGPFALSAMQEKIHAAADLIRPYVEQDQTKFYSTSQFETGLVGDLQSGGGGGGNTTIGLETFVEERVTSVAAQLAGDAPASDMGEGSCGGGFGPGPGQGPGPGGNPDNQGNPLCPDGVCDWFEQENPEVCPEDCE